MKTLLLAISWLIVSLFSIEAKTDFLPTDSIFYHHWNTIQYKPLIRLNENWRDPAGTSYNVPFCLGQDKLEVQAEFFLNQKPPDSLYFYFAGLSWSAEVYLNDRLIFISDHPFEPNLVSVSSKLFYTQWNALKIILSRKGRNIAMEPERLVGIHRQIWLLESLNSNYQLMEQDSGSIGTKYKVKQKFPDWALADSSLFYVPFSESGYFIDEASFKKDLQFLKSKGISELYFPYGISEHLLSILADSNFKMLLEPGKKVGLFRPYLGWEEHWLAEHILLEQTDLKSFFRPFEPKALKLQNPHLILYGLIVCLLLLVIWKLNAGKHFDQVFSIWHSEKVLAMLILEANNIRFPLSLFVLISRVLFQFFILFLGLLAILTLSSNKSLNIFSNNSLTSYFLSGVEKSEFWLGGVVISVIVILFLIKYFFLTLIGGIYNIRDLANKVSIIETLADFPFNVFLSFGLGVLFFINASARENLLIIQIIIAAVFLIRRLWFLLVGLRLTLGIPIFIISFYLCTFEILPWILLF